MDKYKKLMGNTLVFAIATFSSKLLPFVLVRFYTNQLTTQQFGVKEIIITTCNLMLPVMYLCMGEAIIRYGLDAEIRKRDVLTTGITTVLVGFALLLVSMPLIRLLPDVRDYLAVFYFYMIASAMHTVIAQFVRASGLVRLFAVDGIMTTLNTVLLNFLLLGKLQLGVTGFILSVALADAISAITLFLLLRMWRHIKLRGLDRDVSAQMLRYSIPLVPTAVFWWVTNFCSRYFIKFYHSDALMGVYAAAMTLPNMITLVSSIFTQAWQISAFTEYDSEEGERFYSTVFRSYYTFVFLAASGIILLAKPIYSILITNPEYEKSWSFVPFIVLGVACSCLVTFLGTIYNAAKQNRMIMLTTFAGAAVNILLNWILIPRVGAQGAAIATFACYILVFVIRAVDTRKYIRIQMRPMGVTLTLLLLVVQAALTIAQVKFWFGYGLICFVLIALINWSNILFLLHRVMALVSGRSRKRSA